MGGEGASGTNVVRTTKSWVQHTVSGRTQAVLRGLDLQLSDAESLDAAAQLGRLVRGASRFVCGEVLDVKTSRSMMEGQPFPLSEARLRLVADGGELRFAYWGGTLDNVRHFTSATPRVSEGDSVCVFLTETNDRLWLDHMERPASCRRLGVLPRKGAYSAETAG